VIQNALFFGRRKAGALVIPWATYTDPEIAHVGMYEAEALEAGHAVETITVDMKDVGRAVLDGDTEGFLRVHHEKGRLLGCTIVSAHAGRDDWRSLLRARPQGHARAVLRDGPPVSDRVRSVPHGRRPVPPPGAHPGRRLLAVPVLPMDEREKRSMSRWRLLAAIGILAATIVGARALPLAEWTVRLVDIVRESGAWGIAVFAAIYVVCTVALIPASVLTMAAGFVYGPLYGLLVVVPAATLGATGAFLLGRTALRGWIRRRIGRSPRAQALDRAVGREGFTLVFLLRLSPLVPFNVLNYALSLSAISAGATCWPPFSASSRARGCTST